jgi:hypothetical protein
MSESTLIELSNRYQNHNPKIVGKTGGEAEQVSNSESSRETPAENSRNQNANINLKTSTTHPTRHKLGEKAISFFEEKNNRPSTRWFHAWGAGLGQL